MRLQTKLHTNYLPIIMDPILGGSSTPADDLNSASPAAAVSHWAFTISQQYQHLLDKSTPYVLYRWIAFLFIAFVSTLNSQTVRPSPLEAPTSFDRSFAAFQSSNFGTRSPKPSVLLLR
ncbi:unnamed protein product [Fraxinus pennsylvanica]|uniref:Uncharacterized protein n=1 Tax=Fraxinus pennsylvanica TaxID=56036 RepID=A0AAD1ZIT9_9LAMI|nr:unnamed protein product [Fraxinus pennsylvanica]